MRLRSYESLPQTGSVVWGLYEMDMVLRIFWDEGRDCWTLYEGKRYRRPRVCNEPLAWMLYVDKHGRGVLLA